MAVSKTNCIVLLQPCDCFSIFMSSTKPLLVYILCYAGRFGTPGSVLWRVHSANEVTPCTDWAYSGTQGIQWCNLDPVPAACRIRPIKHCQVAHTLKHIHHCRWWRFPMYIYFIYPKHDAVKILFCLDIGIWHPSLEYACCILLFATCSLGTLCIFEYLRIRDWQPIS